MTRWGDERAQSIQVGAIILFGFLVLAFSGYQAGVVPQQNQEVEFSHGLQVESDVQELRNDLLEAGATGRMRNVEVALGTTYPPRLLAMNPSPPGGTLRTESVGPGEITVDAPDFDVEDVCGYDRDGDDSVPSRSFVYEPSYNVYQEAPDVVYENTVVYRDFGGRVIFDSDQRVVDGREITLAPLVGDYQESGTRTVSVDLNGGVTGVGETDKTGQTKLTIPTRLNASQWEELLSNEMKDNGGHVTNVEDNSTAVDIVLQPGIYTVECPVVGAGETPDNSPTQVLGGGAGDDINPSGPGAIRLTGISRASSTNPEIIELTFENTGQEANLSTARFNFYNDQTGDGAEQLDIRENGATVVEDLQLRGSAKSPSSVVTFPEDSTKTLSLRFEDDTGSPFGIKKDDFAVVSLQFTGDRGGSYFVDIPK